MSLEMLQACVQGYQERLLDQQFLCVHAGFWAGYYSNSKKPKPLKTVLTKLAHAARAVKKHVDEDPDVEAFLAQEKVFQERLSKQTK